jgi:hypothetical protein
MRRTPISIALVALVALWALAMVTGTTASPSTAPKAGSAPVTSVTVVCPDLNGQPPGTISRVSVADVAADLTPPSESTGKVAATFLARKKSTVHVLHPTPVSVLHSVAKSSQQVQVSAVGSVAATLAADVVVEKPTGRSRALSSAKCVAPATDWWFTGADGRVGFSDVLVLSNPAPTPAQVAISMWGEKGPRSNSQLESVRIGPQANLRVPIAAAAPDVASVAVHVRATSGAVTAALLEHRTAALLSNGADFIPPTNPPALTAVVSGFSPGKGARYVIITAPGDRDATVNLRLVTKSGSFAPSAINQVVVRAGHTRAFSLLQPLGESSGAVTMTSDQPIIANGISVVPDPGQRPDLMWTAATPPLAGSAAIANGHQPDGGSTFLYLVAPQGASQVRVTGSGGHTQTVSIPAGKAVVADITATIKSTAVAWPYVVTPVGPAPVYGVAAMTFTGAHGQLITSEPLTALPTPIPLPPVREDPSVAVH